MLSNHQWYSFRGSGHGLLLENCLEAAKSSFGIFTLTAPTGAGKTLAMLAFALKHAMANPQIRRIVLVIPFLTIIEQTADIYRNLFESTFGSKYVLEHHSLTEVRKKIDSQDKDSDNENEGRLTSQMLAENWDAPIVLTTSVQFFESLFSNRPGKCRKLHRLANSIILFDEVQTLPPRIAVPSLATLSRLVKRYRCTVVFSTATQPAFDHLSDKVGQHVSTGWHPTPIVGNVGSLFAHARRVQINWQISTTRTWESIAEDMAGAGNRSTLCIVNLKRHAKKLAELLKNKIGENGLFHLSTNMCPAHRKKVLDEVRKRLDPQNPRTCRLVSTQCIEAGVDVDFPVVYRAFGPLDAIAQAAGRCNREGRLHGSGRVVVFMPEKEKQREYLYPPGGYKEAAETTRTLINMKKLESDKRGILLQEILDIYNPELFNRYYQLFYDLTGATDLDPELEDAITRRSFADVAKHYRLIDKQTINILVPYAEEIKLFESLNRRLDTEGRLTRGWILDARPLTINLYRPRNDSVVWNLLKPAPLGRGQEADDWFVYLNPDDYDPLLGLKPPNEMNAWFG